MAGALKQAFIEAVRLTPDGIAAFLETPLPEAPIVAAADDTANEALAAFLLDLFRPFAGLTPVELLLRIGQHNNVLESAMIAGLEYIEGADSSEQAVSFTEPAAGQSYAPGEMRFTVTVKNGTPDRVEMVVDGGSPVKMTSEDAGKTWVQYQTVSDAGEHSAQASAGFANESINASVNFTVTDPDSDPPPAETPESPGGSDTEAIERALDNVRATYKNLIKAAAETNEIDLVVYFTAFKSAVSSFLATAQQTSDTIQADITRLTIAIATFVYNDVKTISSAIMTAINGIYTEIVG